MKVPRGMLLLPVVALILSAGCASLPHGKPVAAELSGGIAERYEKSLPSRFEAMHAVVVEIKPHWWWPTIRQLTLGCSSVDRTTRSYEVTCFSPLGMKLFAISCTNGIVSGTLVLPIKGGQEQMVQSLGTAISNVYMDMTPGPGSTTARRGTTLVITQFAGKHRTDYTFSGTNSFLTSKEYFDGRKKIMTITYGDYRTTAARSFPGRMSLQDHKNGYRLQFLLKEYRDMTKNPASN